MQVALRDRDRVSMCIIGSYVFTYDSPGPVEVDVKALSEQELNQFIYNARRGVLAVENPTELLELSRFTPAAAKSYSTPNEHPIPRQPVKGQDHIEEDLKDLRELLRASVSSVKRQAQVLTPGRVRKLLELELRGKNRKGLKAHLNELLTKHADTVIHQVGVEDVGDKRTGLSPLTSTQITDIVEYDVEQIVLNPVEDKDKDG